jgi:MFS family permease
LNLTSGTPSPPRQTTPRCACQPDAVRTITELPIGCVETAQAAAVAHLAPDGLRGSAFGMLATVQSLGNFAASAIAGLLWTLVSPTAAFLYATAWMLIALAAFTATRRSHAY